MRVVHVTGNAHNDPSVSRLSTTTMPFSLEVIQQHLLSNQIPTDEERHKFKDSLSEWVQSAQVLRNELAAAGEHVERNHPAEAIKGQLAVAEEHIAYHLDLLSGWRRLPIELMGEILNAAIPQIPPAVPNLVRRLRLVCKRWNEIALAEARLWGDLTLLVSGPFSARKVMNWLSRGNSTERSLAVSNDPWKSPDGLCDGGRKCPMRNTALATILAQGPVLNHLTIGGIVNYQYGCLKHLVNTINTIQPKTPSQELRPWDTLQSLALHRFGHSPTLPLVDPEVDFLKCIPPSVTRLEIDLPAITLPSLNPVVLHRLQSLTMHLYCMPLSAGPNLEILGSCHQLQLLSINLFFLDSPTQPIPSQVVVLPSLKTIHVGVHRRIASADMRSLLGYLNTPSLDTLQIRFNDMPSRSLERPTLGLEEVHESTLHCCNLHLIYADFQAVDLGTALSRLTSLKHLTLEHCTLSPEMFATLGSGFLPRLRTIVLIFSWDCLEVANMWKSMEIFAERWGGKVHELGKGLIQITLGRRSLDG